jgi:hypothetical protein
VSPNGYCWRIRRAVPSCEKQCICSNAFLRMGQSTYPQPYPTGTMFPVTPKERGHEGRVLIDLPARQGFTSKRVRRIYFTGKMPQNGAVWGATAPYLTTVSPNGYGWRIRRAVPLCEKQCAPYRNITLNSLTSSFFERPKKVGWVKGDEGTSIRSAPSVSPKPTNSVLSHEQTAGFPPQRTHALTVCCARRRGSAIETRSVLL